MITELRTFIAVVRHGTFGAAGGQIGLTQSAVSSQIRRLEDALGLQLFDRTRRTATLNAAGVLTLARAEAIVALFDRLADPPDAAAGGLLRVGAIASIQSQLLPRAIGIVQAQSPGLRLNIIPGVSMHLMDLLDTGEIDLAVILKPPFGFLPEMRWQTLLRERFVLIVPASVKGRDWRKLLACHPFMRYERKSFGGRAVEKFLRDQHIDVQDAVEIDEIQGLIQLVANGMGVALVPQVAAYWPLPTQVRSVSLGEATFYREIGMLYRRAKANDAAIDQLTVAVGRAARKP